MGRRRGGGRFQGSTTRVNNRRGPRSVSFGDDCSMGGVDSPHIESRRALNRRSQNNHNPTRGRSRSPYRGNNRNNNRSSSSQSQRNHHPQNTRGRNTNSDGNARNRRNNRGAPRVSDTDTESNDTISINPFLTPRHTHSGVHKTRNIRSCNDCSSVRRANLRFRDWTVRALRQYQENFASWAEEANVGFDTADEMDWKPEPVIRVLLLDNTMPPTPPTPPGDIPPSSVEVQQQQLHQIPKPGPWSWPPYPPPLVGDLEQMTSPMPPQDSGAVASQEISPRDGIRDNSLGVALSRDDGGGPSPMLDSGSMPGPILDSNLNAPLDSWTIRGQGGLGEVEYY
ncbi:hypothetical protein F5Y11DRAFT_201205 [Daldinia sp. FL1419]|nr:hypothetical protein F5Y11DRAFT_201205 [Daldinia sp. FL1419]